MSKCYIHANFGQNQVIGSADLEHIITFWSKFSFFLSAVTLKIRSRSRSTNQGFSMSTCCLHANFCQNPVICSGYIVHILMIHANISADTDADASQYVHPTLIFFVGYMHIVVDHIFHFIFVAQIQGKKIQNI